MAETLPRHWRLRGRDRLDALFAKGALGKSRLVLARVLPNGLDHPRLAAVAGRKAGNAVKRNRMRRRLRAAWRTRQAHWPAGVDMVLLGRRGFDEASWQDICRDMERALTRAFDVMKQEGEAR